MADRRRRSPEGSNRRRKESKRSEYDETPRMRPGASTEYLSSSNSSSSYDYIDISRTFPAKSGIRTFFTAPSERRRLRRRRSSRLFKFNNSSSSSIDGDLAYGTGYLKAHKRRGIRSRKGKEIDRESQRHSQKERDKYGYSDREKHSYSDRERFSGSERRGTGNTNAEILAVGAGLAALARNQNKLDLKAARSGKKPEVIAVKETSHRSNGGSRGLGASRISHGSDTFDEEGWESASDAESDFSVDSKLAFGGESTGAWGWGRQRQRPLSRKDSVVDPRLFGPANSLHGIVTEPVGFEDVSWDSTSDFGQRTTSMPIGPSESLSGSQSSLQRVFPVPTTDPSRFEAAKSSVASGSEPYISARPGPAPLQHPQPITPVSQSIYDPPYSARSESGGILKKTQPSSGRSKSLAEAALVGVAGAAIGAAIVSDRKDDRKDKYRDEDTREEDRLRRRDSDKKDSRDERRRDKRGSPDRDDRKDKRREKDRQKDGSRYSSDDLRRDKKREKRRDSARDEGKNERREKRREERRSARSDVSGRDDRYDDRRTKSEAAVSTITNVDPFVFQVDNDAFPTPTAESSQGHRRVDSVPTVVTVEREPDFIRKRSSSIKELPSSSKSDAPKEYPWDDKDQRRREKDSRDRTMHDAESIYQETEHSTAPIAAAAMGAAVAAVAAESTRSSRSEKRRDERRSGRTSDYDQRDSKSRGREPERDPIQEEADRAYREIVMARKIASQVIRSRSASPDPSVVSKYDEKDDEEIIRIVTPPGMEDHKKKGPYDAPNADFRPDYEIKDPRDLRNFSLPSISIDRSNPESGLKRDPDATKPRPLLNLVYPTPTPSPLPEKQAARSESKRSSKSRDRDDSSRSETARSEPARSPKSRDREETSKSDTGRSSKSKDREDSTRSEAAWSEPGRSSKSRENEESNRSETAWSEPVRSSKAKDREEKVRSSASEGFSSPTTSTVSKGVTWGQNETKHFEVESPSEHKDEFVSSSDVKAHETPSEPKSAAKSKSGGWGAIAAGIMGAGVGAAAASSSDTSRKSKESEKKQEDPYEYRGVVVEPESPPRRRSPPSTGPKPYTADTSRVPGAFNDDLDFTATVAAGLQDTGFDPNIVINDPSFRRRDSPPGSNEPGIYRTPYAETVSDLGAIPPHAPAASGSSQGFVMGEVASTPQEWRSVSPDGDEFSTKLSKKEQKKRDKAAKRQSADMATFEETPTPKAEETEAYFEPKLSKKEQKKRDKEAKRQSSLAEEITVTPEPSVSRELVEEPESYFEPAKKSKKKSKRDSANFEDFAETSSPDASRDGRKVSIPADAFDDLRNEEDEWARPKSKKKSKRDSDRYDSPARSVPSEVGSELERSSSKKSKDKSKRKSVDPYEPDPAEVSLPPSTPSETSRDGDYDERKSKKLSSRDSGIFDNDGRGDSRSVVLGRYDDEPRKSKKKSRSGTRDEFDDTRSVASAPAGDDFEDSKKSKKDKRSSGSFFGLFGSKSESGAREDSPKRSKDDFDDVKKKKKSKRSSVPDASSLYGDLGATSVNDLSRSVSNGHGSSRYDDDLDSGNRSDGERKKTRPRAESASSKKDSFLGKAGTLGAGVGLAGAAVAIAAQHHQQSKADHAYDESKHRRSSRSGEKARKENVFDYEIKQREFRPSIDPQYGDLLPLPPSDPASPNVESLEDLPDLPDSGPETPEAERLMKERSWNSTRKSLQGAPMKSPSHSAVPLKFIMGNRSDRSIPSSPGLVRSSPAQSPATPSQDSTPFSKPRHRPTSSWESAREYKPLYLLESSRRSSQVQVAEEEAQLPELPPSQRTSRSSSQLDPEDEGKGFGLDFEKPILETDPPRRQLSVDTGLATSAPSAELLDSQQSTPKAGIMSHDLEEQSRSPSGSASKAIAAAGLVSTIGYFASSPSQRMTKENWLDDLPPIQRQPSPVDAMTKDRSSYLLQSSPMSRKDDLESEERGVDSPLRQKSAMARDSLHSIEEHEGHDITNKVEELPQDVPAEEISLPQLPREPEQVDNDIEPADDFSLTKSKKDKKRDKKKGKAHSRASTQDDISLPEPVVEPTPQVSASGDIEPEEEFSTPKSKKDKKKDKKKIKSVSSWEPEEEADSSQQPPEQVPEESQEFVEPPAPLEAEPVEEFSIPKPKKDKKKDKKKGISLSSREPEEDAASSKQIDEGVAELSRDIIPEPSVLGEIDPLEEFSTPKSKKGRKKDKGKAVSSWEPADNITPSQDVEPFVETSREMPISKEPPTALEVEPSDEFTMASKKDKKKSKKKNKSNSTWEPEEENTLPQSEEPLLESSQEVPNDAPTPVEADPFEESFSSKSKKDKKKDKKKGKSSNIFEPEQEQADLSAIQEHVPVDSNRDLADEPAPIMDDFQSPETRKSKKEKRKSKSWQPEDEVALPEPSFQEPEQEAEEEGTAREAPASDNFESFSTKKSKKNKKGKSTTAWEAEEETQIPESPLAKPEDDPLSTFTPKEVEDTQEFVVPGSKKSKKKGKKSQSLFSEDTFSTEQSGEKLDDKPFEKSDVTEEDHNLKDKAIEEPEQFVLPGSKKSKKKSRKSQAWEDDPEPQHSRADTPSIETPVETESIAPGPAEEADEFSMPSSKKGKKKSRKSQAFDFQEEAQPERARKGEHLKESEIAPEASSTKATPMGDPESWETASSTPWATAEGSQTSSNVGYFPSTAALHSSEKRHALEDAQSKSYFPSSTSLLPAAVAGAAAVAAYEGGKHFSQGDDHTSEQLGSKHSEFDNQSEQRDTQKPTPDGFAAGYKDDQLSLARQLQEEFSSGSSKKSKKDKKKRQSLPATPDPESSQSRNVDEPADPHPRARSLSIGPPAESDQRKSLYSEDQLELARQLKADFEKGSKKSKKDKKKRGESLDPSTRDNAFDQSAEASITQQSEPQDLPRSDNVDETPKGDGFAAGYQEDQLSLARQLQAEFGSGSKKSKKDKKRRSTSQTPQDQEPSNEDYFGASAQAPVLDTPYSEEPASIAEFGPDNETTRDGLAVGYKEEQLELARQLKEEFGSGSKKSKKGKKDKKNQNLEWKDLDDGFSSGIPAGEPDESLGHDAPAPAPAPVTPAAGSTEPLNAEPEDEFAFVAKSSKKDKKGKKRDSLARTTTDDNLPSDAQETRDVDITQPKITPQADAETAPPTDDFEYSTKKSKKDKKGKKRESLLRSTTDENLFSDAPAKESEAHNAGVSQPDAQEPSLEPEIVEPIEEFEFTTKKSKKDKKGKKRESLVQTSADDIPTMEAAAPEVTEPSAVESREIDNSEPTWGQESQREPEIADTADEFAFTTKKSKKGRKGKNTESSTHSVADAGIVSDQFGQAVEALHNAGDLASEELVDAPSEPVPAVEEEWALSGKKSKKDKKKRQSLPAQDEIAEQPTPEVDPASINEEPSTTVGSAIEAVTEPLNDFGFTSKKSKKDKKKRQSLLQSSTFDDAPEPSTGESDLQVASGSQDVELHNETVPEVDQDDGFEFTSKKSKKDKKKRQSMPEPSAAEEMPRDLQEFTSIEESGSRNTTSESQQPYAMPIDEPLVSAPEPETRELALDDATSDQLAPGTAAEVAPEEPESQFEEFSFFKKSKKDKKKRKDSSKPGSEEASGISTALDPLTETTNAPAEPSLPQETVQPKPSIVEEILKPVANPDADGTGVWDAFSTKKSKKDKRKKKNDSKDTSEEPSEVPTPIDAIPKDLPEATLPSDNVLEKVASEEAQPLQLDAEIPVTEQGVVEEPEKDGWSSFSSGKKSKKDKKKRKSGLSTPIETIPEAPGPIDEPTVEPPQSTFREQVEELPTATEEQIQTSPVQDIANEPEQDDWASASIKKSKKDKKKRQSGFSTPIEVVPESLALSEETSTEPSSIAKQVDEFPITSEEPAAFTSTQDVGEQDDWSSFSTKKSKKDKKKRQSGLSTPIESIPESPAPIEETIPEASSDTKQIGEFAGTSEEPLVSTPIHDVTQEPEQDERSSFSAKKSKKDKKKRKSGISTAAEEEHQDAKAFGDAEIIAPLAAGAVITAVAANTFSDEPSQAEEPSAAAGIHDTTDQPVEEEWGSFSTKKSKKDKKKRKSGLSTPIEAPLDKSGPSEDLIDTEKQALSLPADNIAEESKYDDLPVPTPTHEIVEEPKLDDTSAPATLQETEEPTDEWSAFSTKKSKKDKTKRKSGLSTPAEEFQQPIETAEPSILAQEVVEEPPKPEELAPIVEREANLEAADDWAPLSRKQSKKDKKRKSGLSTPAEEIPETANEPSSSSITREVFEEPARIEEPSPSATSHDLSEDPVDGWGSYSTKKSKKDKKRKSGLSTPAEEAPEIAKGLSSSTTTQEGPGETAGIEEQSTLVIPQDVAEEPIDEWASHSTKKSKKDKKRKSGLSTPAEEVPEIAKDEPSSSSATREVHEESATLEEPPAATTVQDVTEEPVDNWAGYETKKSKKDKKKRKSGLSTPAEETVVEPPKSLEFEKSIEEPKVVETQPSGDVVQAASENLDNGNREAEDAEFGFVTKKSKKDKKGKKGSRVTSKADDIGFLQKDAPVPANDLNNASASTSENLIANSVDIEQEIGTDKIKDATLSAPSPSSEHHRSEEMDTVTSDLSRTPSKKDKRKRQATVDANMPDYVGPTKAPLTSWADEVEEAEVERKLPVIEDIAKDESLSHIALTTESSPVDDFIRPNKKGKKGKKRDSGSIGSASIAESFRPPIGEDAPKKQTEEHSDIPTLAATGAAVLAGAALLSKSGEEPSELSTPVRKLSKKEKRKMSIDRRAPRDDMFDDPALWEGADPKEFEEESKGQDDDDNDGFWSAPQEDETPAELVPSPEPMEASREPTKSYDEDTRAPPKPPAQSAWGIEQPTPTPLGLTDIPPLSHQSVSPSSGFVDQSHGDREATFEEAPVERAPSRKSRYNTGFSELPVVREESPVRHEADRHHTSRHQDDDVNRDSAFITESPIPPQGAFTDSHEHVRDSGVHLRDPSPPQQVAAPVSSSDDALARLSWPQVDEESETVNINKSLRPKVIADKHRHEEKSSRSSHHSQVLKEDRDIDFFRAQRPADEQPTKHHHHHDEVSSRDLLPSQKAKEGSHTELHRTSTIHKAVEERPKHYHGEAEQYTDLHRTQTIRGSDERPRHHDEEFTSRDIHSPHSERDEKHTDLHRTKTIHGSEAHDKSISVKQRVHRLESSEHLRSAKPREEGSVKERVQRPESPDSHRASKPKEAKYSELNQSQIPKAERPQGVSDTAIAAGTVAIAGAGLGFAAARQLSAEKRPDSAASQRSASNINRLRTPDPKFRSESANSHRSSGTPPLRRSDRKISGDLRSLSQRSQLDLAKEAELAALSTATSSVNTANPTANEGRVRAKDMADVYVS